MLVGHRLIVTSHHIVADGWSVPIMNGELLALHTPGGAPPRLPGGAVVPGAVRPARRARSRRRHGGVAGGARQGDGGDAAGGPTEDEPETVRIALDEQTTATLTATARTHGLTLSSVVHTAWGLVLGAATGRTDVVFGTTVSGRDGDLPGVEQMVGLFINTLPARLAARPGDTVVAGCARWQAEQAALLDHQHLGLAAIQRIAGLRGAVRHPRRRRELPGRRAADRPGRHAAPGRARTFTEAVHYPLALIADPGRELAVELRSAHPRCGRGSRSSCGRCSRSSPPRPDTTVAALDLLDDRERSSPPAPARRARCR